MPQISMSVVDNQEDSRWYFCQFVILIKRFCMNLKMNKSKIIF